MAMRSLRAELHVHTVLSPCAQVEMIPPIIVRQAVRRGISIIAITDHNSMANFPSVLAAAEGYELTVLPGVELQTREDVHLLCLFTSMEHAAPFQALINQTLPKMVNDPNHFGEQYLVDPTGDFLREEQRLLLVSTSISLEDAVSEVRRLHGLAIPAHVDRKAFGLIPALGFVPPGLPVNALEISRRLTPTEAIERFPKIGDYPILLGGDAHHPDDILGANLFHIEAPTITELELALQGAEGRSVEIVMTFDNCDFSQDRL